jgi:Tfp pilus assembly protein PilF
MMKISFRLLAVSLGALVAAGCATTKPAQVAAVAAPPPAPAVHAPAPAAPSLSPADGLALAVSLLEKGDSAGADTQLKQVLAQAPDNKSAQYLIQQIEAPVATLYPKASFPLKLDKNATLSVLAQTYLGNSLGFYGLARYNAIAVPSKIEAGQIIRIPETATALAAKAQAAQQAAPTQVAALPPHGETDTQAARKMADRYYKAGMIALQRQDLDGAIAAWDKVLAIDPNYKDVQLNRAQALQLKENLKKLGG